MNQRILSGGLLLTGIAVLAFSGCQGAACGNCGAWSPGYGYPPAQPYGAPPVQGGAAITPPPQIQPGVQYPPGTVPIAPQQMQPGTVYGGGQLP